MSEVKNDNAFLRSMQIICDSLAHEKSNITETSLKTFYSHLADDEKIEFSKSIARFLAESNMPRTEAEGVPFDSFQRGITALMDLLEKHPDRYHILQEIFMNTTKMLKQQCSAAETCRLLGLPSDITEEELASLLNHLH